MSCRPSECRPRAAVAAMLSAAALALAGCESLNPYESTHLCEGHAGHGRCATVREAYDESLGGADPLAAAAEGPTRRQASGGDPFDLQGLDLPGTAEDAEPARNADPPAASAPPAPAGRGLYQEALYREMAGLIRRPATPMLAPARTVRALVFPYRTAEGASLFMPRHIYMIVEPPRFLLGDHLLRPGEGDDRSAEEAR